MSDELEESMTDPRARETIARRLREIEAAKEGEPPEPPQSDKRKE